MSDHIKPDHTFAIIGAGFGGLGMGEALKRRWRFDDFVIYERGSEVGGCWRANTYPGCHCDLHVHAYSLSTNLNPKWPRRFGSQAEILDYMKDIADRQGLRSHFIFNTSVVAADWDAKANIWRIITKNVQSGEISTTTTKILISAAGILAEPNKPYIDGVETFKGPRFHSAEWDHSVDMHGKRVAVIGNGASAGQIVPALAKDPTTQVINFCRDKAWFFDGDNHEYSAFWRWAYTNVPLVMRLHRLRLFLGYELFYLMFKEEDWWITRAAAQFLKNFMLSRAPKEYHGVLIPPQAPGCKRGLRNMGYLEALQQPNCDIEWSHIKQITEDGILTKAGTRHRFDVIVYATGFLADKYFINVRGSANKTVQQFYDEQDGPEAYLGSTLPGFPNFMLIQGPNTTTGHNSVLVTEECQFHYALELFKPVVEGLLDSVEPKMSAHVQYNAWLQARLSHSVFVGCQSWYRTGSTGKIYSMFPGPLSVFWLWTRKPKWEDYNVAGVRKEDWERKRRSAKVVQVLARSTVLIVTAVTIYALW